MRHGATPDAFDHLQHRSRLHHLAVNAIPLCGSVFDEGGQVPVIDVLEWLTVHLLGVRIPVSAFVKLDAMHDVLGKARGHLIVVFRVAIVQRQVPLVEL